MHGSHPVWTVKVLCTIPDSNPNRPGAELAPNLSVKPEEGELNESTGTGWKIPVFDLTITIGVSARTILSISW